MVFPFLHHVEQAWCHICWVIPPPYYSEEVFWENPLIAFSMAVCSKSQTRALPERKIVLQNTVTLYWPEQFLLFGSHIRSIVHIYTHSDLPSILSLPSWPQWRWVEVVYWAWLGLGPHTLQSSWVLRNFTSSESQWKSPSSYIILLCLEELVPLLAWCFWAF